MNEITPQMLAHFSDSFHADPRNTIRQCAVVKMGVDAAAENHRSEIDNPMVFSIELEDTGAITNQKASGRCWLFAALNIMRQEVIRKDNLETFELSQNYLMFWDKLEKANEYLTSVIETSDKPANSRIVQFLMARATRDGGQWDMYAALAEKYGCVPKSVMPETYHSSNSAPMNRLLSRKLAEDTDILRDAVKRGSNARSINSLKEMMLCKVYSFLSICLGEPPTRFDFEYRDKKGKFHRDVRITPQAFFQKHIGLNLANYVSVVNSPVADKPFAKTYTIEHMSNVIGGRQVKYLNLPIDELQRIAIAQLSDGLPVWFGCDFGQMCQRDKGVFAADALDYESATGLAINLDKENRIKYHQAQATHAMVLIGVNLVDGQPNRWKVEDSHGEDCGRKGYFSISNDWFKEHGYQLVAHKKYLNPAQRNAYNPKPISLPPWDAIRDTLGD